jgi:hypothetical protein
MGCAGRVDGPARSRGPRREREPRDSVPHHGGEPLGRFGRFCPETLDICLEPPDLFAQRPALLGPVPRSVHAVPRGRSFPSRLLCCAIIVSTKRAQTSSPTIRMVTKAVEGFWGRSGHRRAVPSWHNAIVRTKHRTCLLVQGWTRPILLIHRRSRSDMVAVQEVRNHVGPGLATLPYPTFRRGDH